MSLTGNNFDRIMEESMKAIEHERFNVQRAARDADKIVNEAKERLKLLAEFSNSINELAIGKLGPILIGPYPFEVSSEVNHMSLHYNSGSVQLADWMGTNQIVKGYYRPILILQPTAAPKKDR